MNPASFFSKHKLSQSGQGILEVIVTIGIGTIMILALVVLSIRANRSSDFSKASSQASSLAQEGMEAIKNLIKANTATQDSAGNHQLQYSSDCIAVPIGTDSTGFGTWDQFWNTDINDQNTACAKVYPIFGRRGVLHTTTTTCGYTPATFQLHFANDDGSPCDNVTVGTTTFIRDVYVADTPTRWTPAGKSNCNTNGDPDPAIGDWNKIKQFTVDVSWTDTTGTHHQTQTECIHKG